MSAEHALRGVLDALPLAFALFDAAGRLVEWSARLVELELFPKRLLRRGLALAEFKAHDAGLTGRAGKPRMLRLPTGRALRATARRVAPKQLLVTYEDVTDAQRTAERLDLVERAVSEGIYDYDIVAGRVSYSGLAVRTSTDRFGRNILRQGLSSEGWLALLHPADRERFSAELISHFKSADERFECEFRLGIDGQFRWFHQYGTTIRDARGRAVRMIGATADVTARKEAELALERAHAETAAALERQTATAEILKVIARSPSDVRPVFDAIARSAIRLVGGHSCSVTRVLGDHLHLVALTSTDPAADDLVRSFYPMPLGRRTPMADVVRTARPLLVRDTETDPSYTEEGRRIAGARGFRTIAYVPMLRGGAAVGVIHVAGAEANAITDGHVQLLQTFADQAVIAIENVRLFNETQEALERQTATAEILKVIAGSPSDVEPVFDSIAESAHRLLSDAEVGVTLIRGDRIELVAAAGLDEERLGTLRASFPRPLDLNSAVNLTVVRGQTVHYPDVTAEDVPSYTREAVRAAGIRAMLGVPLLRDGKSIGGVFVSKTTLGAYTEKQIELLRAFADQAVIAIENTRLLNETKEALEQQRASAEVLNVISNSVSDAQPVFEKIVESCERLFATSRVGLNLIGPDGMVHAGAYGKFPGAEKLRRENFPHPVPGSATGAAIGAGQAIHYPDALGDPDVPQHARRGAETVGFRAFIMAPLLSEGRGLGAIFVGRETVGSFSEKEHALLKAFADQAVIAIENARLFNETREALERQTATAEILKVIASSPSDVQPVFDAIAHSAHRLFNRSAAFQVVRDGVLHIGAIAGFPDAGLEKVASLYPMALDESRQGLRAMRDGRVLETTDILAPGTPAAIVAIGSAADFRSLVTVPLLRGEELLGQLSLTAEAVRPRLDDKQIGLLKTFADQAVIAIENVRLFNETHEALERQTATADILQVIASSPADVQPVFDAIAASAVRLCDAVYSAVVTVDDGMIHIGTQTGNWSAEGLAYSRSIFPMRLDGDHLTAIAIRERRVIARDGLREDPDAPVTSRELAIKSGYDSLIIVPMCRGDDVRGAIVVTRISPFSDHQTALLHTFADQAVIAIENVRLFNETKEALERQTATAEILKVIASSPSDVQPVFEAIVENAARLMAPCNCGIMMLERDQIHFRAAAGATSTPAQLERMRALFPIAYDAQRNLVSRAIAEKRVVHVDPVADDAPDSARAVSQAIGARSITHIPLVRSGNAIGTIAVRSDDPAYRLSDKQLTLIQTFADQAVIAIENVRLFNETREALERQTATAEILRVISRSPTDIQPVLDAVAESAARLCEAADCTIYRLDGNRLVLAAHHGSVAPGIIGTFSIPLSRESIGGRTVLEARTLHVADIQAAADEYPATFQIMRQMGLRAMLSVPLMRDSVALGAIQLPRTAVRPFTDRQIALLETFADQAVIAIENVRLFNELRERTDALTKSVGQLTALGEVGRAISSTLDLDKVLPTIVSRAVQLMGLDGGAIYEYDEAAQTFTLRGGENLRDEILELNRSQPIRLGDGFIGRAASTRTPVQVADLMDVPAQMRARDVLLGIGARALLAVPLLTEGHILGALAVIRNRPGDFAPEAIRLLETFATQSAIAIQNARLFREIEDKSRQLEGASKHKSQFLASMSHELRTPLNAILGFNEMILAGMYGDVPADMQEPLADIQTSGKHLLRLINNVLDLAKIEAGRMELALADYSVHDTVESVRATLWPLAAEKGLEFTVTLPEDIPLAHGDSGRITQCLVNLAGNSLKFTKQGRVEVAVEHADGLLTFRVSDTGIGIAPEKISGLFTEFKQTDATIASEYGGSGLGLSIVKKFVEMHGGRIWVESEPGQGSDFIFEIPLRAGEAAT